MKKKLLSSLLIGGLCLVLCAPVTVYADGQKVVTLGADLTQDQKTAVLKYFGVLGQNIQTLTITNQDEREHLGSYVPLEQIGSHTYSCALVCPTNSGGIQVKTANLSWVTSNMIATTLSTSGVVNCDVLAASPFEVSGTGALTGIIMAYEAASGTKLNPARRELATQELITTGTIANRIGQSQATNIVNEIKIEVIQGQVVEPADVEEIIDDVVEENEMEVELSEEDRELLFDLMTQIAEQQYDYDEMRDTLERVEENVSVLSDTDDEDQTGLAAYDPNAEDGEEDSGEIAEWTGEEEEETEPETLPEDSILLGTDDSALGENVTIDATNEEAVQDVLTDSIQNEDGSDENGGAEDDFGFDITSSDSYGDDTGVSDDGSIDWSGDSTDDGSFDWSGDSTDDGSFDWSGESTDDGSIDWSGESADDGSFDWSDDGSGEDISVDDSGDDFWGEEFGEENGNGEEFAGDSFEEGGEEVPEAASLTLGQSGLYPDSSDGSLQSAGLSQFKLLLENADVVPVSGTLTIADGSGNVCCTVDLANGEQVKTVPVSDEDYTDGGWDAGTKILINTGYQMPAYGSYTVVLDGTVASASDPAATATVSSMAYVNTDSCGIGLNISRAGDVYPGAVISGSVIMDESMAYGEVSDYNDGMVSFDNMQFSPDATGFNINCLNAGTTSFSIDFYDADGNYLSTASYELTILN